MDEKMHENREKGLRNLMKGNGHDKIMAENMLKKHNLDYFTEGILDVWLKGSEKARARGLRVLEAWGITEDDIPVSD